MSISASDEHPATTLDRLEAGSGGRVVAVGPDHAGELLREGILPGTYLGVRGIAPIGGPVIVELGQATVAVARPIAATVRIAIEGEGLR